ncbi:6-phosphofructo-2-kinase/fructose-2,6-bisphosphatase [Candidatus Woesearchaeota archaeon]|nr:6-phosphofructo-2-kinase/fructose-2,6-bisphosphatase [Candidatus Woesearchaeota archaeon]
MKLCIAMVGLPAMGKSTIALKLKEFLVSEGLNTEIFNNGDVRRQTVPESNSPEFYNPKNKEASKIRRKIADINIEKAKNYDGDVVIIDATNVGRPRRKIIEKSFEHVLFIECVNKDEDLIDTSILQKIKHTEFRNDPDAFINFKKRIGYYKKIYNPLKDEKNYIVLDSLNNLILKEKGEVLHYENIRDILVSNWLKNLYLVRHEETFFNQQDRIGGDSKLTKEGINKSKDISKYFEKKEIPFIFTSTKKRTIEMANILASKNTQIIKLPEFDEINSGICEEMSYQEIKTKYPEIYYERKKDKYNFIYPEGESYDTLRLRVAKGLKKAMYIVGDYRDIMIIGHRAVNRVILSHFLYRKKSEVPYIYMPQDKYYHIISTHKKKLLELKEFKQD